MNDLNLRYVVPLLFSFCVTLVGCSNSSKMFRYDDDVDYDSLFVQRDFGAKVFIVMNNGKEYTGELLRVRDSTMILCKKYEAGEEDLRDFVYPLYSLRNNNIKLIELTGENHLIAGIIFGALAGAVSVPAYGLTTGQLGLFDDTDIETACLVGTGIGMLIGGFIGGSNTTSDEIVYEYANPEEYNFTRLNIYARYGGEEPDYFKEIR
ncbi:hypothetical protein ACFLSS_02515 [Bacteroidota bacterium]